MLDCMASTACGRGGNALPFCGECEKGGGGKNCCCCWGMDDGGVYHHKLAKVEKRYMGGDVQARLHP